ncbi:NB-ARC domain-containing protein [Trichocoleus sp. DQ-U1]|uniref:NB-ARC domain-containing protein n=1 Tax=Trichocoleus sp. DQ-U1 TaxID=2933926 RepID=UPI003299B836
MNLQQQKRRRGVILTPQGLKKLQAAKSEAESCEKSNNRYTLEALSDRTGLDPDTLMKVFACDAGVDKRTLSRCFRAFNLLLEQSDYDLPASKIEPVAEPGSATTKAGQQDWGEAPECGIFSGRTEELATLTHWILSERCRLVTLLGIGGIGKTCLSVKLALQIQDRFEFVIWRSLRNAPPLKELLAELIRFLSNERETDLPATVDGRISLLIRYLKLSRCLLVFDNAQTVLHGGDLPKTSWRYGAGHYREGYEDYGELLKRVGETPHQSCLVLTSREKPKGIGFLEGETLPVRVLKLKGLEVAPVQEILRGKSSLWGSPSDWSQLSEYYAGNPLALKIVSTTIHKLFHGNISDFLSQKITVFGEIRNLLEQQFKRLSETEKIIINCLALSNQILSFSQLREKIPPSISPQKLLEALESLEERSLIEKKAAFFFLQPVVMEFVSDQLIEEKITQVPLRIVSSDEYPRFAARS